MKINAQQNQSVDRLDEMCKCIAKKQLDEYETAILSFLKEQKPDKVPLFLFSIRRARQTILQRLAGAVLRENIADVLVDSFDICIADWKYSRSMQSSRLSEEKEQMLVHRLAVLGAGNCTYKIISLPAEEWIAIPVSKPYAFQRFEVNGDIFHIGRETQRIEHAVELLRLLRMKEIQQFGKMIRSWESFADELRNGSANLALAYAFWEERKVKWRIEAQQIGVDTSLAFARTYQAPHLFFEQLCTEGHNLHPGTKTKMGMAPADVYRYAPECEGAAWIQFVAVHRTYVGWNAVESGWESDERWYEQIPQLRAVWYDICAEKGVKPEDYLLIPVHSWQMKHAIPYIYAREIERQMVIPIANVEIPATATSSFRSVELAKCGLTVKAAVNSQMTSTVRSISMQTAANAPEFTRLMRAVLQREQELSALFIPIEEVAGFYFHVPEAERKEQDAKQKSRNLSVVIRGNIGSLIGKGELAIVASSLYARSPLTEKTILAELVEAYAQNVKEASLTRAARRFFAEYSLLTLKGYVTFMVKYGIGLEGHMQNSVPVFHDGRPVRMLIRDWGGARIFRSRLEQSGFHPSFYPGSVTITDDSREMHNKVFYTVIQNHLAELIVQLCETYGDNEQEYWKTVYEICEKVFHEISSDPAYAKQVQEDREMLYQPYIEYKALAEMRLCPEEKGYCYRQVPNPLYAIMREAEVVSVR
jgi:siderophore synthetase component